MYQKSYAFRHPICRISTWFQTAQLFPHPQNAPYAFLAAKRFPCVVVSLKCVIIWTALSLYMYPFEGLFSLLVLSLVINTQSLTPSHHLTTSDVARLQAVLSQPLTDLKSAYYSVVGLGKLGIFVADADVRKNIFHIGEMLVNITL